MTVIKSFSGQSIRVLEINNHDVFELLNNLLYVTSKALNVKENINDFQAFDIINTLIEDYKDVKIEEFIYIFKQGKKGIYGPHYNKFDIETIINWINSYFASEEYNNFLETRHLKSNEKIELTQEQKDNWKKTLSNFTNAMPEQKQKEDYIKSFTNQELNSLLKEYTDFNYKEGVDIINKELNKRSK